MGSPVIKQGRVNYGLDYFSCWRTDAFIDILIRIIRFRRHCVLVSSTPDRSLLGIAELVTGKDGGHSELCLVNVVN